MHSSNSLAASGLKRKRDDDKPWLPSPYPTAKVPKVVQPRASIKRPLSSLDANADDDICRKKLKGREPAGRLLGNISTNSEQLCGGAPSKKESGKGKGKDNSKSKISQKTKEPPKPKAAKEPPKKSQELAVRPLDRTTWQAMGWMLGPEVLQELAKALPKPPVTNHTGDISVMKEEVREKAAAKGTWSDDDALAILVDLLRTMRAGSEKVLHAGAVLEAFRLADGLDFSGDTQEDAAIFYETVMSLLADKVPAIAEAHGIVWKKSRSCDECGDSKTDPEHPEFLLQCELASQPKKVKEATVVIQAALEDKEERLQDVKCSKCRRNTEWTKVQRIERCPQKLAVKLVQQHLSKKGELLKDERLLKLPATEIQFERLEAASACRYRLEDTVKHRGNGGSGHYASTWGIDDSDSRKSKSWFVVDDDKLEIVDLEVVQSHRNRLGAYLSFFNNVASKPAPPKSPSDGKESKDVIAGKKSDGPRNALMTSG